MTTLHRWMPGTRWGSLGIVTLAVALAAPGCAESGPGDGPGSGEVERVDAVPDTVVGMASGLVGALADMAVGEGGTLHLLDAQARAIHVVDSTGRLLRTVGRPGEGPGELGRPAALYLDFGGDAVVVVDPGNARLESFGSQGEHLRSRPIPPCALGPSAPTLGTNGRLVAPTLGFQPVLAVICSPGGDEVGRIGELMAPGQSFVDMAAMRAQIDGGEVPDLLLNSATVVAGVGGATWLVLSAARQVERYGPAGEQSFRSTLAEPGFEAVRARWIQRNAELDGFNVAGLNYFRHAREVAGDLWILLESADEEEGVQVVVLTAEGEIRRRPHFSEVQDAGSFMVDEARGWIYFSVPDRAEVVGVGVPGVS